MGVGVGVLFISHSGRDNEAATKVRDWLRRRGWGQVFLDLDPEHGLAPGHRWQQELKQAGERCSGVLVLLSPNWVASRWCQTEFLVADQLGKKIFPVFIAPTSFDALPLELKAKFQIVDISDPGKEAEGFDRLAIGLKRAGLDPGSFEWPPQGDPHRPIYRGLQSLDEEDAAIFFGRDAQITKGLDALRRIRDGAPERMLVILGASGAGKSSFLKAGLIARLRRDEENFVVLPVIRPERAALTGRHGLAAALSCDYTDPITPEDIVETFGRARASTLDRLRRYAQSPREVERAVSPTVILPIDQAEELFAAENTEAVRALELLAAAVPADSNTIIIATIRSDAFARMQYEATLTGIARLVFDLAPIPQGAFKEVIEGPARIASPPLAIEPALTEQLLKDIASDDTLPLLAFTLERLLRRHHGGGALGLSEYINELGGLQGAITAAVESAFEKALRDPSLPHDRAALDRLARAAFIPALVQIDDADAEPRRRLERLVALPEATRPLVRHLIDERLLITDHQAIDGVETDTVEVAHESILRQWTGLKSWIAEEREGLRVLDGVRTAAREWHRHGGGQAWLTHSSGRLEEAEQFLAPEHFMSALSAVEKQYLAACRGRDNAQRERERNDLEREKKAIARTRRLQRNVFVLIGAAAVIILIAGLGIALLLRSIAARSSDVLAHLANQAAEDQDYERAARYAIAGLAGADWPILGYAANEAERQLRGAMALSQRVAVLRGHTDTVRGIAWNPDGTRVVTTSDDGTARIWNARTGDQITILLGHHRDVRSSGWSYDGGRIVTASGDGTARIWDARTGSLLKTLRGHEAAIRSVAWSRDGEQIVTASDDKTARIWDVMSGKQILVLRGHEGFVRSAGWSPDSARVVTASQDKTIRIWDAHTGTQILASPVQDGIISSAAFSPDGTRIVSASTDNMARIWDAHTLSQIAVLRGHDDFLTDASFSRDGNRIVTASADKTARIWDAHTGTEISILRGHDGPVEKAAFSPDGNQVATTSQDKTARIWNSRADTLIRAVPGYNSIVSAAFDRAGSHIVTSSLVGPARIWNAGTGDLTAILGEHFGVTFDAAYSNDGKRIVTVNHDSKARIWDVKSAAPLAVISSPDVGFSTASFSPDGMRVVTVSGDRTVRIWNAVSGASIAVLRGHEANVESAVWSPDGQRIVSTSDDKTARIWDVHTDRQIAILRGHEGFVLMAAFSRDGSRIVTASLDKTARIWNAYTGSEIAVLRGHSGVVTSAAWSPSGTFIATSSDDRTARIWDTWTGAQVAVLRGHGALVGSVAWSPDGKLIFTTSLDNIARFWRAPLAPSATITLPRRELIELACNSLLAGSLDHLSHEELAMAPDLDPKLDANVCNPPTAFERLQNLFFAGHVQ